MDLVNADLAKNRQEIVEDIKDIRVQSLRHVKVSENALKLAKSFVKKAPNVCVVDNRRVHLRYRVLYAFPGGSGSGVYEMLAMDAKETTVDLAEGKFDQWLAAVGSLQRYALNLLLAPKRPEFQTIKLFSSFYIYEIAEKLPGAENILIAMGYCRATQSGHDTELRIEGRVDLNQVVETAADLVILQCDLELLKGNAKMLAKDHSEFQIRVSDILQARSMPDQVYPNTYEVAVTIASSRQHPISGRRSPASADHFEVLGSEPHALAKHQYTYRTKSSEGFLDQTVPVHGQDVQEGSLGRSKSMPEECSREHSIKSNIRAGVQGVVTGMKESHEDSVTSQSSLENSMMISYSKDVPRPNPDDLPAPIFDDETGFTAGGGHNLRHVSEVSYEGNRAGLYINPSSSFGDPLEMLVFSPDDNHNKRFHENVGPERVAADGPDSYDSAMTNISKTMLRSQFLKQSSANGAVEVSHPDSGRDIVPDVSKDSTVSEERKTSSPLDSVGEKRKRDSPFTSFEDSPKTSPHTSIDKVDHDSKALEKLGRKRDGPFTSLEDPSKTSPQMKVTAGDRDSKALEKAEKENTRDVEQNQRPRANHISEKAKGNYRQNSGGNVDSAGRQSSSREQWVCAYCTLLNAKDVSVCEVCEIPFRTA